MNTVFLKQTIEKAIKDGRWLQIDYVGKGKRQEVTNRLIEPIELRDKDGILTLDAYCFLRDAYRPFQLEGIMKIEVVDPDKSYTKKETHASSTQ